MVKKNLLRIARLFTPNSIRSKLILLCVLALLIPLVTQMVFVTETMHTHYLDQYSSALQESLDYCSSFLSSYLSDIYSWSDVISNDLGYINLLSGRSTKENAVRKRLDGTIKSLFESHAEVNSLAFWTANDQLRTRISRDFNTYSFNWSTLEALCSRFAFSYEELCEAGFLMVPRLLDDENKFSGTFTAVWAIPSRAVEPLAILIAQIDFSAINSVFSVLEMGEREQMLWIDAQGKPFYANGSNGLLDVFFKGDRTFRFHETDREIVEREGEQWILIQSEPFFDGSRLVRILSNEHFSAAANAMNDVSLAVSLLGIVLTLLVIIWGIRRFTRPLHRLGDAMLLLGEGNFDITLPDKNLDDELEPLIFRFNDMTHRINQLIAEKYELTIEQQKAELRALQAQINPHFLYNTLQMLNSMALKHNAYEITMVINSLGEMLHYCLQSGEAEVTLADEVENIKHYLTIQKMRFLSRLNFAIQVDPQLEKINLPRMTLQPLVENCVVHGMKDPAQTCSVLITAQQMEDCIEIEVRNTGSAPIESEKLKHLTEYLYDGNPKTAGHIGLKNCYLRLKYYYRDSLGFSLSSTQEEGTCVHIKIYREGSGKHEVSDR